MSNAKQIAATVLRNYSPHARDAVVDGDDNVRVLMAHDTPEELVLPRHIAGVRLIVEREDAPTGGPRGGAASSPARISRSEDEIEGRILERLQKALGEQIEAFEKRLEALEKKPSAEKSTT